MSDAVSRDAVLDILTDEGWLGDSLRRIRALPAVQPDARIKQCEEAYQYALHLAEALRENYPPNPDFRFLGDLVGLLTQIDNMLAGLSQPAVQPNRITCGLTVCECGMTGPCKAPIPAVQPVVRRRRSFDRY